jgi:purine-binding chemotaxis protein CheW
LPLASLRGLLGLDEAEAAGARAIVMESASPAALAVDSVEALVSVAAERVETRQAELASEPGELLTGAFPFEGLGVAKILDVKTLLDKAFAQRTQRKRHAAARTSAAGTKRRLKKQMSSSPSTWRTRNMRWRCPRYRRSCPRRRR